MAFRFYGGIVHYRRYFYTEHCKTSKDVLLKNKLEIQGFHLFCKAVFLFTNEVSWRYRKLKRGGKCPQLSYLNG